MKRQLVIALAMLAITGRPVTHAQADFAAQKVQALHITTWGLTDVMRQVSEKTGLTIGVELDGIEAQAGTLELDFPGGTVADLAVRCISLKPGASWKIVNNRSLLVYVPGKATDLSQQRITYGGMTAATRRQVWEDLSNHSEINQWLDSKGCKRQEIFVGGNFWEGDTPTISIPAGGLNLGDILEAAASQSPRHYWRIVEDQHGDQCFISISL